MKVRLALAHELDSSQQCSTSPLRQYVEMIGELGSNGDLEFTKQGSSKKIHQTSFRRQK